MTVKVIRIVQYEGTEETVRAAIQKSMPLGIKECAGYNITIAEHLNELPPAIEMFDFQVEDALDKAAGILADAVEARAKEIYESWSHLTGYVPWVTGGNSTQQANARRLAYSELSKQ